MPILFVVLYISGNHIWHCVGRHMVDNIVRDRYVPIHRMKLLIGIHYLRADHQTIIFITPPRLTCI